MTYQLRDIKGSVVVITGATTGIGAAAAKQLVELGCKVVLNARNEAKLQEMVARKRPGDKVEIKYLRKGKEAKATATLKNISGDTNIVKVIPPKIVSFNGVTFEDIKPAMKERLSIEGGAGITAVEDENWKKSGAKPGFIITSVIGANGRNKISNSEQLVEILKDNIGEEIVILGLYPNGQEYYFEIKVE